MVAAYPGVWVGNHSAASFGQMLNGFMGERWGLAIPGGALVVLPLAIWSSAAVVLVRRGYGCLRRRMALCHGHPPDELDPKHKPRLQARPACSAFCDAVDGSPRGVRHLGRRAALAQIACACGLLILVSVSYTVVPPVLGNKYPFIFALQLLLAWVALASPAALPEAKGMVAGTSPSREPHSSGPPTPD